MRSPDPASKIPAIKQAVKARDTSALSHLVEALSSDDPAVRFYAIQGLRRLTGENFGYRYYDSEIDREPAIQRWQQWLAEQDRSDDS